jgi:hypothetical protein
VCAIGYGFGLPTAFIFGYFFVNGRIGKPALTRQMFMFLIGGYQNKYWFWQAIIMVRKMALVLIVVFINDNSQLQSYCGMWTMSAALIGQIWFQPNSRKEYNTVEALSLAIITITLNLGLLYFWPGLPEKGRLALTGVLITITIAAMLIFLYFVVGPVKEMVKEKLDLVREKVRDFKEAAKLDKTAAAEGKQFRATRIDSNVYAGEEEMNDPGAMGGVDRKQRDVGRTPAGIRIRPRRRERIDFNFGEEEDEELQPVLQLSPAAAAAQSSGVHTTPPRPRRESTLVLEQQTRPRRASQKFSESGDDGL